MADVIGQVIILIERGNDQRLLRLLSVLFWQLLEDVKISGCWFLSGHVTKHFFVAALIGQNSLLPYNWFDY